MYPLLMSPYFRPGEQTPWGGSQLKQLFGKNSPDDRTGESLEISALPGMDSVVANGELAGVTLSKVIELWGEGLTGLKDNSVFPLLLKLLDAKEMLSVQVHPGDGYAMEHEGKLGKTEAWVVLMCEPGAKLVYGVNVKSQEELQKMVDGGQLEQALQWISIQPGDVLYIPHGMVHALGGGIMVYEIQQSSDVTYRFWDWGRVGKDGKPRELHTRKAIEVTRPDLKMGKLPGATIIREGGNQTYYISDENFELSRLSVSGKMPLEGGRMRMITALGEARLSWDGDGLDLKAGDSVLIPAGMDKVYLEGRTTAMCVQTPDGENLKEALGYRADQVAGLSL